MWPGYLYYGAPEYFVVAYNSLASLHGVPSVQSTACKGRHLSRLFDRSAKLEEALQRMKRVVSAVEKECSRPSPMTIERVLSERSLGNSVYDISPAFKQALDSGKISTRRRAARDLKPIPYTQD